MCMKELGKGSIIRCVAQKKIIFKIIFWGGYFHFCGSEDHRPARQTFGKNGKSKRLNAPSARRNGREEVQQVIIEKTKALLSGLWQQPLHQAPPTLQDHHPILSTRGNFLLPLFIYPPHSSPPPSNKMGIITLNNATTAGLPRLHFGRELPTSTISSFGSFWVRPL